MALPRLAEARRVVLDSLSPAAWTALTISLILGFVSKLPGLFALENYSSRAYAGLWYSDIIALYLRAQVDAPGGMPYRHFWFEYPVLTGAIHALGIVTGGAVSAFIAEYLVLAVCAVLTAAALGRIAGARPLVFAAAPALTLYAGLNWDLAALAPLALACTAFLAGRHRWAGVLLGIGISAKLFPLAFLPPMVAARWGEGRRRDASEITVAAVLTVLALNVPVAIWDPAGWAYFFTFSAIRAPHSTIWNIWEPLAANANMLGPVIVGVGWLALTMMAWRRPNRWLAAGCTMLLWWLLWNKVASPQFTLFVMFVLSVLGAPVWLALTVMIADLAYFVTSFQSLAIWQTGSPQLQAWYSRMFVAPFVYLRLVILALCTGWAAWRKLPYQAEDGLQQGDAWRITSAPDWALPDERQPAGSSPTPPMMN